VATNVLKEIMQRKLTRNAHPIRTNYFGSGQHRATRHRAISADSRAP
jgi:hypothetical protein